MEYANTIFMKDGKVLLQLRDNLPEVKFAAMWCLPGGGVDENEEPKEAAIREFAEETGYLLKDPQLLLVDIYDLPGSPRVHIFYELYTEGQKISCLEGEKMEFKSWDEIEKLPICLGHEKYIKKAFDLCKKN